MGQFTYLYKTRAWQVLRQAQLSRKPICERCFARGAVTAADVVNHKTPHRGDLELFYDDANLESVCKPCHDSDIQAQEKGGYSYDPTIGSDGLPLDSAHPFFQ